MLIGTWIISDLPNWLFWVKSFCCERVSTLKGSQMLQVFRDGVPQADFCFGHLQSLRSTKLPLRCKYSLPSALCFSFLRQSTLHNYAMTDLIAGNLELYFREYTRQWNAYTKPWILTQQRSLFYFILCSRWNITKWGSSCCPIYCHQKVEQYWWFGFFLPPASFYSWTKLIRYRTNVGQMGRSKFSDKC